jgi:hypothetical protein
VNAEGVSLSQTNAKEPSMFTWLKSRGRKNRISHITPTHVAYFWRFALSPHLKVRGGPAAVFPSGTILLTVKDKKGTTNWTLTGSANQTTSFDENTGVLFTELRNGIFGWIKNKKAFTNNQFSIDGPSGQ